VYLRLLVARRAMSRVLKEPMLGETQELETRLAELRQRLEDTSIGDDLRRSLTSQAEILEQRVTQRREGRQKLDFLEAEILRIQEQVELLREQAALSTDAEGLSARLDEITGSLGGASQWISDQQKLYGTFDDLLEEPPPVVARTAMREAR
jgi:chromosome segregation ATPase